MEFYSMPYQRPLPPKLRNGLVWYAIILPVLGIVLENFATNKYLGMLVWAIVIVMRPVSCLIDRSRLEKDGHIPPPAALAVLPTFYLFRRAALNRGEAQLAVVCALTLFIGAVGNGFVRSARMTEDDIIEAVKITYLTSFSELSGSELDVSVEDAAKASLSDHEYSIERDNDKRTITLSGSDSTGAEINIEIVVLHDGFTYNDLYFGDVYIAGEKVNDEGKAEFLKSLFAAAAESTDSSGSAEG